MATFEQVGVIFQIVQNLHGLVGNMRDNAAGYKVQAAAPEADFSVIRAVMVADANEYVRRIGWITALSTRSPTLFSNALAVFGMTPSDAASLRTTLLNVCNHTIAATLTTQAQINTESDFQLANVPNFERLW